MRKLAASLAVAGLLVVPAGAASASEIPPPAGTDECRSGQIGKVVWHWDPVDQEYVYYRLCIQTGP